VGEAFINPEKFKQTLLRGSLIPLFFSLILSAIFSLIVLHLVDVLKWVDHTNEVLAKNYNTQTLIFEGQSSLRGYVITKDEFYLEMYKTARLTAVAEINFLVKMTEDNPIQTARYERLKSLYKTWLDYAEEVIQAQTTEGMSRRFKTQDGRRIMEQIRKVYEEIIDTEESLLHQRNQDAKDTITLSITIIVLGSLVVGLFLAYYSRRSLNTVTESYAGALVQSADQNRVLEKQGYLKELQLNLSKKVTGNDNLQQVSNTLLESVCETMRAKVGVLYLLNGRNLNLQSSFALPKNHQVEKTIEVGSSMLGQAVIEKRNFILNPAPQGYLKIQSVFGESDPVSLLIVPVIQGDTTIGVFEFGFARIITDDDQELLKTLNETIAYLISSAEYRERLQELLEQAQRHAEELQAQQEELRVVNEELEQQSRALKESHVRLENQQAEMEQTNQQLEEQTQELENQKNLLSQTNNELEQKSSEIKKASNYKSEFLANMSHELRTPLNSTLILAKLLIDNKPGNLTKEQQEYAQIIFNSGTDLLNLINDILDLSKVEAGKMTITPEIVSIEGVVKNLNQTFKAIALEKKLEYKFHVDENVPHDFITDRQRLEQILKNFLSNAFKFTSSGGVSVHIFEERERISFAVADTGIGMSADEQNVIFEAFRQADGTTNRKFGGTGLGLSISKEFAALLGGEISLKSSKGEGSTFTLTLPRSYTPAQASEKKPIISTIKEAPATTPQPTSANGFSFKDDRDSIHNYSRRMLIIEDDESFAKILYDLAHEMKFGALVAETGDEGLNLAKSYQPNAIVLDVRLPDHSGMIVLDQLKMNTRTRHIPVHVISSEDFSRSALEMGAVGYMLKPVKNEELHVAFQNMSSMLEQKVKHVLIVEDDAVQRNHIAGLIADPTVVVTAVDSSKAALEQLSEKTFDCMIMDLSLPDMSGHVLLAKLSNESSTYSFPPVIVYTARDLTLEEEQKLRLYSGSIIIKGAKSPERLLSEVTLFLHKVETELPPERQKMLRDLRSREKNLEDRTILVVDDDVRNIFALTSALETHGAKVQSARNGREALEKLNQDVDLVLMDIMMPEMDGYEAMRRIRLSEDYKEMPVIALTAKAMKDDKEKCIEAGANDYLPKPIEMDKLLSLIRVWLPQKRRFS
jgi:CheY-like chemotaxis protein/CHASE3 domain sensor protein